MVLSEEKASRAIHVLGQLPPGLKETRKIDDEDGLGARLPGPEIDVAISKVT